LTVTEEAAKPFATWSSETAAPPPGASVVVVDDVVDVEDVVVVDDVVVVGFGAQLRSRAVAVWFATDKDGPEQVTWAASPAFMARLLVTAPAAIIDPTTKPMTTPTGTPAIRRCATPRR
jgi:hypothetical protein